MRVAVLAPLQVKANRIIDSLAAAGKFTVTRVNADTRLAAFDVLIVDGVPAEELMPEGPPMVLIEAAPQADDILDERMHAVLPPDFTPDELAACVTAAALELTVLTKPQARTWIRRRSRRTPDFPLESLTARELEVLRMMADGLGNKEVAGRLGVSDHTAKFHVAQILAKLRAASRAEAVAIGIRRGLVPI